MGGGANGHYLGLVCTPEAYLALVPEAQPDIQLDNLGSLEVSESFMQYQIAQVKEKHVESTRIFREMIGIDQAIIQQVVVAIGINIYGNYIHYEPIS